MYSQMSYRGKALALSAIVVWLSASPVSGQKRQRVRPADPRLIRIQRQTDTPSTTPSPSVLIEPAAPIANLFSRAEEGIARRDWKFAIDCLQRIINDPQGSLVVREGETVQGVSLYESARRQAIRRLASLPPEGLRAYRLLFDGRAKRHYERARASYDPKPLRIVVDRYILTRYGDDAADLLASWAVDVGRPGEAIHVLTDLRELVPDSDVPERLVVSKLAAAYAMIGRTEDARSVIDAYRAARAGAGQTVASPFVGDDELSMADALLDLRPSELSSPGDSGVWPVVGGSAARRGWMPYTEPTLSEKIPWRADLPGARADAWRSVLYDDPSGALILPVGQLVADATRVFARTRRGCIALRKDDLSVEWTASALEGSAPVRQTNQRRRGKGKGASKEAGDAGIAFEDQVAGGIALGEGLVLIVSREGNSEYSLARRDAGRHTLLAWLPKPNLGSRNIGGSQLIAYDVNSGRVRWRRGRSGHQADPLDHVQFASVPIAVDGLLWVPFVSQGDLHIGILDPEDGALVRSISLCHVSGKGSQAAKGVVRHALHPASADGLVFVASDGGVLFAIDTSDLTIRWATEYGPSLTERRSSGTNDAGGWLSTELIVAGGLLLVTPREHEELLAFAAASGEPVWSATCEGASYTIAADHDHVWVGGRRVLCISLSDGELTWTTDIESVPTGRAVLAERNIYAPTLDGLVSLDVTTGERLANLPVPASLGPLGNLLCLDDAMFSINPSSVRKFPDLERAYPVTLAQYEADPTDPVTAVRLAWLELMRDRPQRAYEVVAALEAVSVEDDARRAEEVAHVRVEALLALASRVLRIRAGRGDADVLALLEEANDAASKPSDRLRCALAIAEQLELLGRHADAFRRLWQMGISRGTNQLVAWEDHVEGTARLAIAKRLSAIAEHVPDGQLAQLREYALTSADLTGERLGGAAGSPGGRVRLRAVADLDVLDSVSQRARLELATYHAQHAHYEQAELLFRDGLRGVTSGSSRPPSETALTLAAHMGLCSVYANAAAAGYESVSTLQTSLNALEDLFKTASVPQALGEIAGVADAVHPGAPVADWVEAVRSRFVAVEHGHASVDHATQPASTNRAPVQLTGETAWSIEAPGNGEVPRMVHFRNRPSQTLEERIVVVSPGEIVSCFRVADGELLWKTTLRTPGSFADVQRVRWREGEGGRRYAVADGQTAVLAGYDGIFAIGLGTGRRIWCVPYEPEDGSYSPAASDLPMAAEDGLLATLPRAGRLRLMRMLDGSTLWERDLLGERVAHIWMSKDRVITVNPGLQRVHIFDRRNGRLIKRIMFRQPDPRNMLVDLQLVSDVLCGPSTISDSDGVVAVDVVTGIEAWSLSVDKPLVQLFVPKDGYLGLGLLGGDVRIVDAATGEILLERRVAGAQVVVGGTLVDGTLVLRYLTVENGVKATAIAALDVATDVELWRRDDVVPFFSVTRSLSIAGGCVPVLLRSSPAKRGATAKARRRRDRELRLGMIDTRTGSRIGESVTLPPAKRNRFNDDFKVFRTPEVVIVGTLSAIHALRTVSVDDDARRDF